jgi:hypothetical protein
VLEAQDFHENFNRMDDHLVRTLQNKERKYDQELNLLDTVCNASQLFLHATQVKGFRFLQFAKVVV